MKLGLYIHIPFCIKKCNYCDFLSFPVCDRTNFSAYRKALTKEMGLWKEKVSAYSVDTIFIGGGTPSVLPEYELSLLLESIQENFDLSEFIEFSMECNPGTVSKEKLKICKEAGVNRLSFGMQSAREKELKILGRIHTYPQLVQSYEWARQTGFTNINLDLMSAIPGQSLSTYEDSLQKVCELEPEHISSYSLILEEGTPFYEWYGENPPVDEETDRKMYERTAQVLAEHGYERYEISNYAKKGKECRHNLKYWERAEYLGVGLGASSFIGETRFSNETELSRYVAQIEEGQLPVAESEAITRKEAMAEFMYLGLRCQRGISENEFYQQFHLSCEEVYGDTLRRFLHENLLKREKGRIALTSRGIDVSNRIFVEFI